MAEEISSPLLSLVKELGLIDDLQYEEVAAEFKRSGAPVIQLLQDFGIMKLDDILHVMANYLGTGWFRCATVQFTPGTAEAVPAKVAQMYQCLPVALQRHVAGRPGRSAGPGAPTKSILPSSATCRSWWPTRPKSRRRSSALRPGGKRKAFPKFSRNWARTPTSPAR
jgi:hypothetical protein